MKATHIIPILLLFAAASAAYVWLRPSPETSSAPEAVAIPGERQEEVLTEEFSTNNGPVEAREPVQPLEERGDAILFEIEALQNTPFDEAIVVPFD